MKDSPAIAVLMTVHNGERFLRQAIESVLAQTMREFEFLIVDDASSDDTATILAGYAGRDDRINVIHNERNLGAYPSANRALELASAPLIARMDSDDISEPERLERQIRFMRDSPDHLLVASSYVSIDGDGAIRYRKRNPMDAWQTRWTTRFRMPSVHPGFCFRASSFDGTPVRYGVESPVAQDYELASRLARLGKTAVLEDVLVRYRMHEGNLSSTRTLQQRLFARKIAQRQIESHYPANIADGLGGMLDVQYGLERPSLQMLTVASRALANVVVHDDDGAPDRRTWLKRRCAGMLAEAFVARRQTGDQIRSALGLIACASEHLPSLALRLAELRGWLRVAGEPRSQAENLPANLPHSQPRA